MTITNGYGTVAEYRQWFYSQYNRQNTDDDRLIEDLINSVSRYIDNQCARRFYAATETRVYTPQRPDYLAIDDLLSVTTLKTDEDGDRTYETTWDTTDYDLMPANAALDGWPYRWIQVAPEGDYTFPMHPKSIQIAGSFGFASTTPDVIKNACYYGVQYSRKRLATALGASGTPNVAQTQEATMSLAMDRYFLSLITSYKRVF